ncbi:UNVERIFIED_CONTAM: Transcription factor [Sesamum angustifolium]|uniref:Transcription factor n=1 Tax=Sesamum angustifolium TaxID=2727405 RepID=A0AAW2MQH6_9LAMI
MNQGVVQSSPVQQMVAAGSPTWWNINNMRPPPHHHHQHHSFLAAPPHHHFPHHLTPPLVTASSWNDPQELPESWSQLLLGGLVGEEDKPGLSHMQAKKLENWEQQLLNHTSNSCAVDTVKQENSASSYTYGPGNVEFQPAKPTNCWSHQIFSASSPKSCVTTLSNNMLDFSPKSSDLKQPHQDPSSEVRKEKLGDRITALHQLVSPFGKTDTASVLLEAIGYIRFLQSQIELMNENCIKRKGISEESDEEPKKDLRSRGLCLVPISCTLHVGSDNGADYWAPAFAFSELTNTNFFPSLWKIVNPGEADMLRFLAFISRPCGWSGAKDTCKKTTLALGVGDGSLNDDGVAVGADDNGVGLGDFFGGLNSCCCSPN